jgi:alpha,alpha-trehalose phosphorylase
MPPPTCWRTIHGKKCSGYWPTGSTAFHVNADIAYALTHPIQSAGDMVFEKEIGLAIAGRNGPPACYDAEGRFRLDGVTGPDA